MFTTTVQTLKLCVHQRNYNIFCPDVRFAVQTPTIESLPQFRKTSNQLQPSVWLLCLCSSCFQPYRAGFIILLLFIFKSWKTCIFRTFLLLLHAVCLFCQLAQSRVLTMVTFVFIVLSILTQMTIFYIYKLFMTGIIKEWTWSAPIIR